MQNYVEERAAANTSRVRAFLSTPLLKQAGDSPEEILRSFPMALRVPATVHVKKAKRNRAKEAK